MERRLYKNSNMLPSCGWSQEIFIVEIGPRFNRSISGDSSKLFRERRVLRDRRHHQRRPDLLQHLRLRHLAPRWRRDREIRGSPADARTNRTAQSSGADKCRLQTPPCAGRCDTRAVTSVAPGVFKSCSIAPSMYSAIFALAKPESRAFSSLDGSGSTGPSFCASASAISARVFRHHDGRGVDATAPAVVGNRGDHQVNVFAASARFHRRRSESC